MTTAGLALLDSLAGDFRTAYLSYDALQAQLDRWVAAFPALARLVRIGTTAEGRALHVLVIGVDPQRRRPSVWVDANMHAGEVSGSCVALAIAEALLALHTGEPNIAFAPLPQHLRARLADSLFYLIALHGWSGSGDRRRE